MGLLRFNIECQKCWILVCLLHTFPLGHSWLIFRFPDPPMDPCWPRWKNKIKPPFYFVLGRRMGRQKTAPQKKSVTPRFTYLITRIFVLFRQLHSDISFFFTSFIIMKLGFDLVRLLGQVLVTPQYWFAMWLMAVLVSKSRLMPYSFRWAGSFNMARDRCKTAQIGRMFEFLFYFTDWSKWLNTK